MSAFGVTTRKCPARPVRELKLRSDARRDAGLHRVAQRTLCPCWRVVSASAIARVLRQATALLDDLGREDCKWWMALLSFANTRLGWHPPAVGGFLAHDATQDKRKRMHIVGDISERAAQGSKPGIFHDGPSVVHGPDSSERADWYVEGDPVRRLHQSYAVHRSHPSRSDKNPNKPIRAAMNHIRVKSTLGGITHQGKMLQYSIYYRK